MTKEAKEEKQLTTWETAHGPVSVTPGILRQMFKAPTATDLEVFQFVRLCQAQKLNPFLGEAYLIKYDKEKPASFVTGKETFTQRAEAHPDFDGVEAGIIVKRGDEVEHLSGSFKLPTDELVGGWAKVHRKNWTKPTESSVAFSEYSTGRSLWKTKPATMIRKVALVQALREAFPSSFAGLYDSAEMGQDLPQLAQVTVEHQPRDEPSTNGAEPPVTDEERATEGSYQAEHDQRETESDPAKTASPATDARPTPPEGREKQDSELAHAPQQPTPWDRFVGFVRDQDRTLDHVAKVIGTTATKQSVYEYIKANELSGWGAMCDRLAEQWGEES